MADQILEYIKNMQDEIKKIMIKSMISSFSLCILALIILLIYIIESNLLIIYEAGIILFKTGGILSTFSFICSVIFDKLYNRVI